MEPGSGNPTHSGDPSNHESRVKDGTFQHREGGSSTCAREGKWGDPVRASKPDDLGNDHIAHWPGERMVSAPQRPFRSTDINT